MSTTVAVLIFLGLLLAFPLGLIFCTIVARDMDERGLDGRIYGLVTFLVFPIGLIVWLVQRAKHPVVDATP